MDFTNAVSGDVLSYVIQKRLKMFLISFAGFWKRRRSFRSNAKPSDFESVTNVNIRNTNTSLGEDDLTPTTTTTTATAPPTPTATMVRWGLRVLPEQHQPQSHHLQLRRSRCRHWQRRRRRRRRHSRVRAPREKHLSRRRQLRCNNFSNTSSSSKEPVSNTKTSQELPPVGRNKKRKGSARFIFEFVSSC